MHPIEQRLPFFCQPFFCQIELRGWDVAASRNTKFTLAGNAIVQVEKLSHLFPRSAIRAILGPTRMASLVLS